MQFTQLLARLESGDPLAAQELIALQRQNRALRLYPYGRKGALDEGMMPVTIGRSPEALIRIEMGQAKPFQIPRGKLGYVATHMMYLCGMMHVHYSESDDPWAEAESLVTHQFAFMAARIDESVQMSFMPVGLTQFDIALYHARKIIEAWVTFIEQHDWDPVSQCGFTEDEYNDAVMFAVDEVPKW